MDVRAHIEQRVFIELPKRARGPGAAGSIAAALSSPLPEVRRNAFELLERLSPAGSLEPLLLALQSEYADLRIGVIERLATQSDARVTAALQRAMLSDHDDLRLRAAELLAERKDDQAAEVLGLLLRAEDRAVAERALVALLRLGSQRAVQVLAARLERDEGEAGAQLASRKRAAEALEAHFAQVEAPSPAASFTPPLSVTPAEAGVSRVRRTRCRLALARRIIGAAIAHSATAA